MDILCISLHIFIGDVNFYYIGENGEKKVGVMNIGDSNYITPFTPHSFATRKDAKKNGCDFGINLWK